MKKGLDFSFKTFSANNKAPSIEEIFEGYPSFEVPYPEDEDYSRDEAIAFEHARNILLWSDQHPPKTGNILDSNIYFVICFESRDQKEELLEKQGLLQAGDKYLSAYDFAAAMGIDLKTGQRCEKKAVKKGLNFLGGGKGLNFTSSLSFGNNTGLDFGGLSKKKEISEELKAIRKDEKKVAEYMQWTADPEYWICICFNTKEERENCLKAIGLPLEYNDRYMWGLDFAKSFGIELTPCPHKQKDVYSGREKRLESFVVDSL